MQRGSAFILNRRDSVHERSVYILRANGKARRNDYLAKIVPYRFANRRVIEFSPRLNSKGDFR